MSRRLILMLGMLLLAACGKRPATQAEAPPELPPVLVTSWSEDTELFLEYSPLVAGQKSRLAIHFTKLRDFKPVSAGRVEVQLRREGGLTEGFVADAPSRPGIFGVEVQVKEAGSYRGSVRLRAAGLEDVHDLGTLTVHPSASAAAAAPQPGPKEETVKFLKEQQWTLEFATETVRERKQRESIRVPAEIEPRTGGVAEVTVPFAGRFLASALPALGTSVKKGEVLASLLPPTSSPADLPALELARAEAEAALELAHKDRARIERLVAGGALPVRRLDEAKAVESTALARLKAAQARIAHYEATRAAEGDPGGARAFLLRAPISGVIAETHATSGANVEVGENLFKIVDVSLVYASGSIPEAEAWRLRRITGAEIEVPGLEKPRPAGRLVSTGRLVDPKSRTIKVIYELDNRDRSLAVGQAVFLRLFTSATVTAPAVPESAMVDDSGRPIVFVQLGGEAFVRRPVKLGNRESGYVQVLEGLRPGERAVIRGANLIRLASLSGQVPAHGHVH